MRFNEVIVIQLRAHFYSENTEWFLKRFLLKSERNYNGIVKDKMLCRNRGKLGLVRTWVLPEVIVGEKIPCVALAIKLSWTWILQDRATPKLLRHSRQSHRSEKCFCRSEHSQHGPVLWLQIGSDVRAGYTWERRNKSICSHPRLCPGIAKDVSRYGTFGIKAARVLFGQFKSHESMQFLIEISNFCHQSHNFFVEFRIFVIHVPLKVSDIFIAWRGNQRQMRMDSAFSVYF